MATTIGQILVNETLPEKFRDYSRTLGADELEGLLKEVIKNDPSVYKEVSAKLMRLGAKAAFDTGTTLRLSDLEPPFDNRELYARLDAAEDTIRRNPKLTDGQKEDQIADLYDKVYSSTKQEAYNVASAKGNGFAMQVKSKARGNQDQLSAMINTPGIYSAPSGKVIPLFIRHSFAEGLTPAEYWAGSYGARSAIMCLSLDTEVLMGDWSVRKIIDIKPGDTVMGSNANGQMYPVSVLRVYDNGVQPVYRFSFRVGSSRNNFIHVDATEEHKMLARLCHFGGSRRDGTCKPDSLSAPALVRLAEATPHPKRLEHSKYVAQLALEAYTPMGGVHNEFALLLGLIAGDGCCSPTSHGSITLSCADPELISDISDYLHTLGITLKKSKGGNYNWVLVRSDDCPITWHTTSDGHKFNNRTRAAVWEVYGGCLSHTKDIPEGIWSWDNESILAYLSGIIATDGSVYQAKSRKSHGFSFAVNSLKLLLGVKNLLERRFGIFCGAVHEMQRKRVHHMYGITIDHPKAAEKFFRLFENLVPGVKKHVLRQAHGVIGRRSKDIGCRVAKKEFLGNLPVMDIEVGSPDHMFVLANGLVSSNSTKFATAKAGALGKLFSSSAIEQVVTEDDCGTIAGMPVKADDKDNIGSVLAQDVGDFKAGTVITKQVMADLKKANVEDILVRSPVTCNAKRGVCSHCAGIRENGKFPEIGYNLGLNSASALAERIAQGGLNAKHCLVEGTKIRMANGSTKPIEQVSVGDTVLGSDLNGNIRPVSVVALYDNGVEDCVRTRFIENGTRRKNNPGITLESTTSHKLLGTRVVVGQLEEKLNWVPRELEVGKKSREFFGYSVSSFDDTGLFREPLAMLLGALLGDGCYTDKVHGVYFSCADDTEISDLSATLEGYDLKLHRLKYHNGIYYRVSQHTCVSGKNVIKNYLVKHGMYGKLAHEKEIPDVVHTWDNTSVGCFIGGLIATDGSVYTCDKQGKPAVAFSSTSRRLVEQFKELLGLRFGILCSAICKTGRTGTYCRNHDQWQVTITKPTEVRKLAESITIPGVKQGRLHKLILAYTSGNSYFRTAFKRVSQEPIGKRHVYDIEVDHPNHLFLLANGLIVSNSGRVIKGAKGTYSGFEMLKRMATIPGHYADKATVSEIDGRVERVEKAPQGGSYVWVNDEKHYVPSGYDILVKPGDEVEAGDQLSDGVISPADAVRLKGIGEGRRYFTQRFTQAYRDSGYKGNRRNVESIARALINNVVVDTEDSEGQMLPGDEVTYSRWAWGFKPRQGSVQSTPRQAVGKYLEQPALHYTIGTRVTKKVADELEKFKVPTVLYNEAPPGVHPEMRSIVETTGQTDDWMGRLGTTYIGKRLVEDVQQGAESNSQGLNPYPAVAKGTTLGQWGAPGHKNEPFHY